MRSTSTPGRWGVCGVIEPPPSPASGSSLSWPPSTTSTSGSSASTPTRSKRASGRLFRAGIGVLSAAVALASLTGCSLQQPLAQANQSQAEVGKPAPDFSGTDLDGRPVRLSDYRGQPLVINFWASWCGPCRAEEPGLIHILDDYGPRGLQVLGVTVRDNLGQAKIYRDEFK